MPIDPSMSTASFPKTVTLALLFHPPSWSRTRLPHQMGLANVVRVEHILAVKNDVFPFDGADMLQETEVLKLISWPSGMPIFRTREISILAVRSLKKSTTPLRFTFHLAGRSQRPCR